VVRLRHNNIARVYAMGDVNGEYFLAMEYVQGKTVSRFTRRLRDKRQIMPLGQILLLGERVCQGLSYAHDVKDEDQAPLHLVHRDLSPANVCISYRGEVKIIDFGAAQSTLKEEQTAPRVVIGNLTYMAPEQAKKQFVDRRADVYSVGVMLWELLAWHALPQKGDPIERWRRAANPVWDAPSLYRGNVPSEIDQAILKALKKVPDDRFPDAGSFGAELTALRKKFAPAESEKDIGALLSLVFKREKQSEDEVLLETTQGVPLGDSHPTDKTKRPFFVPPNVLAFEHKAIAAPGDWVPGVPDEITDPAALGSRSGGTPTPRRAPSLDEVNPTRVGFGVTFPGRRTTQPEEEDSIIEEIEAIGTGPDIEEYHTAPYDTPGRRKFILLCAFVFAGAIGLGFAGIYFAETWTR
jgi:eukaryotic-like serine/threonine-protein kinase